MPRHARTTIRPLYVAAALVTGATMTVGGLALTSSSEPVHRDPAALAPVHTPDDTEPPKAERKRPPVAPKEKPTPPPVVRTVPPPAVKPAPIPVAPPKHTPAPMPVPHPKPTRVTPTTPKPQTVIPKTPNPPVHTMLYDNVDRLAVAPEHTTGYDRALFGTYDPSVRLDVLDQEIRADGTWLSVWDLKVWHNRADLEVDHTVALKEAWDSGAWKWTPAQREAYARDTDNPYTLNAITATLNSSKGDKDGAWAAPANRCLYVREVTQVKTMYNLTVDPAEKATMLAVAATCKGI